MQVLPSGVKTAILRPTMKACFVLQGHYAKIGHAMAKYLKETHGVSDFCAYIFSPGAHEFIKTQRDIAYNPILVDHLLHENYQAEVIDRNFLERYEQTYGPPYPWQYLYCDRKLMMSIGPKEETTAMIDPLYDHDTLIRTFQARARAIERMLIEAKPDFIVFFAMGALGHLILYHVAKKLGIKVLALEYTRIGDLISITEDYNTLTKIEETFRAFRTGNADTPFHAEGRKIMADFKKMRTLKLQGDSIAIAQLPGQKNLLLPRQKKKSLPERILASVLYLRTLTKNYLKNRRLYTYGETDMNPLRFIWYRLKQRYRLWRGCADLYDKVDLKNNADFVFFPLHYEPELAILLLSPFYFNQIELIRYVARSLPLQYKLYVKEHPAMYSKRARSYYKELKKIPNVVLVDTHIKSFDLIQKAKLVTTITGSAGWEAVLLGKPVITFGSVFYNALSFVTRLRDIETLPRVIREKLTNFTSDQKELDHFVAACLKESIDFDFCGLWYENDFNKLYSEKGMRSFCDKLMAEVKKPNPKF